MALILIEHDSVNFTAHYTETGSGRICVNFNQDLNMKGSHFCLISGKLQSITTTTRHSGSDEDQSNKRVY